MAKIIRHAIITNPNCRSCVPRARWRHQGQDGEYYPHLSVQSVYICLVANIDSVCSTCRLPHILIYSANSGI